MKEVRHSRNFKFIASLCLCFTVVVENVIIGLPDPAPCAMPSSWNYKPKQTLPARTCLQSGILLQQQKLTNTLTQVENSVSIHNIYDPSRKGAYMMKNPQVFLHIINHCAAFSHVSSFFNTEICPALLTSYDAFYFSESIGPFRATELNFGITEKKHFPYFVLIPIQM